MASNVFGVETLKLINENFGGIYMFRQTFQPVHTTEYNSYPYKTTFLFSHIRADKRTRLRWKKDNKYRKIIC